MARIIDARTDPDDRRSPVTPLTTIGPGSTSWPRVGDVIDRNGAVLSSLTDTDAVAVPPLSLEAWLPHIRVSEFSTRDKAHDDLVWADVASVDQRFMLWKFDTAKWPDRQVVVENACVRGWLLRLDSNQQLSG